ncbi:MAG: hypothetical protein P4M00_03760 [Azospirillaceae bacterium]|nr:hypothetical protein [Azospirillaceae bacterium]
MKFPFGSALRGRSSLTQPIQELRARTLHLKSEERQFASSLWHRQAPLAK